MPEPHVQPESEPALTNEQVIREVRALQVNGTVDPDAIFEVYLDEGGGVTAYYAVRKVTYLQADSPHRSIIIELDDCISTSG